MDLCAVCVSACQFQYAKNNLRLLYLPLPLRFYFSLIQPNIYILESYIRKTIDEAIKSINEIKIDRFDVPSVECTASHAI